MAQKTINISISEETADRLDAAAEKTGLKKSTIAEQGIDIRLSQLEKADENEMQSDT